jgi:hypothetical protein
MPTVTSENREEFNAKEMAKREVPKKEKSLKAKIREHVAGWKKIGDYKNVTDEGAEGLAHVIHSHHAKDMKPEKSKLAQISGYGKKFEAKEYIKREHAEMMHKGGILQESGDKLNPDRFTDEGHAILTHYLKGKM